MTSRTPSTVRRNPLAPVSGATERANAQEIATTNGSGGEMNAQPEVSRIEIQTSDPNIRIIWLTPATETPAQPLK
jgi:hypothetical protein